MTRSVRIYERNETKGGRGGGEDGKARGGAGGKSKDEGGSAP